MEETASIEVRRSELESELPRLVNALVDKVGATKVVLFGSFAKGEVRENSDLDLLAIVDTPKDYYARRKEALLAIKPRVAIDLFIFTPEEISRALASGHKYLAEVLRHGRILYEA